jgi:hypothetical protein
MKTSKLKILLMIVIIGILTVGMPIIAYGTNENAVVVKQSESEYIIYLKGYLDKEFKFAFSDNKEANEESLTYTNSAKDTADGENNIAYSNTELAAKKYMFVKADAKTEIFEIDVNDNITKAELENLNTVSKNIPIKLEQEQIVNEVNENGTKITETVGVAKLADNRTDGKYQLIARKTNTDTENFFALAELLEKKQFADKYTEIKASKEFVDLKEKLQGNLSSEEWKNIENNTIKQPNDAQTGDQYILWLTAENDNDVHFLTSYRNYDEEIVEKEIKTVLPYTYDNNTLLVVLGIVIIAIIAVSVRIAILKKKEMSK